MFQIKAAVVNSATLAAGLEECQRFDQFVSLFWYVSQISLERIATKFGCRLCQSHLLCRNLPRIPGYDYSSRLTNVLYMLYDNIA